MTHAIADLAVRLADLERAHDGPLPTATVNTLLTTGCGAIMPAGRHHDRLAATARAGVARRRGMLGAGVAADDPWLERLVATLAHHRAAAAHG